MLGFQENGYCLNLCGDFLYEISQKSGIKYGL